MLASIHLYVGCYTTESPAGIRVYDASDPDGSLEEVSRFEGLENPSFLAVHPSRQLLYAVSETADDDGIGGGSVAVFAIDEGDASLTLLEQTSSHGAAPCHLSVDAEGRHVFVANYASGTVAIIELRPDGRFGQLVTVVQHHGSGPTARQEVPHAHCVVPHSFRSHSLMSDGVVAALEGVCLYAVDLGADRVFRYDGGWSTSGYRFPLVDELVLPPGSGPRHLAFHPNRPLAFVVCELDSTLEVLDVDPANGRLNRHQTLSTLPDSFDGESIGAEVRVHPDGRHVYVSNRGHDSIAVFELAEAEAEAVVVSRGHVSSRGRTPRNFAIHPSGDALLVANQDSGDIVPFRIHRQSGLLQPSDVSYAASQPVCLTFVKGIE